MRVPSRQAGTNFPEVQAACGCPVGFGDASVLRQSCKATHTRETGARGPECPDVEQLPAPKLLFANDCFHPERGRPSAPVKVMSPADG